MLQLECLVVADAAAVGIPRIDSSYKERVMSWGTHNRDIHACLEQYSNMGGGGREGVS